MTFSNDVRKVVMKYVVVPVLVAYFVILAIIVMHDAMGVRREAGRHAKAINELLEMLSSQQEPEVKLKEFLGHTPLQVCCGAVLGLIVALALG